MKKYLWVILIFSSLTSYSQNQNEVRAVNNYISFVNESIHGMLIAHRLFEGYNQTINKYVDLPDYQLNNYTNADLPDDIFQDPEKWFYDDRNPYDWYKQASREKQYISGDQEYLESRAKEIHRLLKAINKKRIIIGNLLAETDLTVLSNLQKVYGQLEQVVAIYDEFYALCDSMNEYISRVYQNHRNSNSYSENFNEFHKEAKVLIKKLKNDSPFYNNEVEKLELKRKALEVIKIDSRESIRKQINTNTSRLVRALNEYINGKNAPQQYELYGNHYHSHNVSLLNLTNRYGNGYVSKYNSVAQEKGWIKELEVPHFYKVIYPKKLDKEDLETLDDEKLIEILEKDPTLKPSRTKPTIEIIETASQSPEPPIEKKEEKVKEEEEVPPVDYTRGIVVHSEVISITADSFDLELFDHLIKDGDRVSIRVNDEWVFKNISLETEPQTVTIHVTPGKQNYILVHADNTGNRPPNTIALAYTVNGERKVINLKTDLENSQMVEIKYGG